MICPAFSALLLSEIQFVRSVKTSDAWKKTIIVSRKKNRGQKTLIVHGNLIRLLAYNLHGICLSHHGSRQFKPMLLATSYPSITI